MIPTPSSYAVMETGAQLCLQPGILTPSLALYAGAAYVVAYAHDYGGRLQQAAPHTRLSWALGFLAVGKAGRYAS